MSDSILNRDVWIERLSNLQPGDSAGFDRLWEEVYAFQRRRNPVYQRYCNALEDVSMPYLPIEAFKHGPVTTFPIEQTVRVFESSGTGQGVSARHYVKDLALYEALAGRHFAAVFGSGPFTLIAHLPHYTEKGTASSLVQMVSHLMNRYGNEASCFFLDDIKSAENALRVSTREAGRPILFGAAFGLLTLAEKEVLPLPENALVIETGGMKTYRREVTREQLHNALASGFNVSPEAVYSEYGMCELFSQCYTRGEKFFYPPPWMRFEILHPEDPFVKLSEGEEGALAVIDLANAYTVSAILTQDKAIRRGDGFELLGRLQGAELRGCNFLLEKHND